MTLSAFNQALRDHLNQMVQDHAKLLEERYGFGSESTATALRARPPNMRLVIQAQRELEEFRLLTANAFARYFVLEPMFVATPDNSPEE